MYELHENEQYFFDRPTLAHLSDFVSRFSHPCCLGAPLLGQTLAGRGVRVRILDIDKRFATVPGFRYYNIYRPEWLEEAFDLILCDPPFFTISLSQLFTAVRLLAHHTYTQPLLISYLERRAANITGTFQRFGLAPTGYYPGYQTVQPVERNRIEFFSNLDPGLVEQLRGAS